MLLLLALLLPPAPAPAQDQPPTFRTGVSSVLVDTLALDADGNPVQDLSADEFEIYEDGVPQTIATFDVTDWTSYVSERTAGEPTSDPRAGINTYPRRFVFIFNRQGARFEWLARAKYALREFVVEAMADGDEAMVIDIGFSMKVEQPFQPTKEDTLASIRGLSQMVVGYPMGADRAAGRLYRDLESLGYELLELPGRKVIVLMSNELLTFTTPGSRRSDEGLALASAVRSLNQANASVYSIDLRGSDGRSTIVGGLSPLATETGGRFFQRNVSFQTPLRQIGRENARYYLLSYVSTNPETDGTYREIEVRVTRPDVEVIARKGYHARAAGVPTSDAADNHDDDADDANTAEDTLAASLNEAPPSRVIPTGVEMTSYFLPTGTGSARVPVAIALPRELLAVEPRQLTVTISQNDETLHTFAQNVSTSRYYFVDSVELEPGGYLMQITLTSAGQSIYQASTAIQVPSGFGERFGLSSIVPVYAPGATRGLGNDIPILPTTTLAQGDDAFLLFQVFAGMRRPSERVYLTYTVHDDEDVEVGTGGKDGAMELATDQPGGTPVVLRVPMSNLRAGSYRIDVRVEDRSLSRKAASEIELRIH